MEKNLVGQLDQYRWKLLFRALRAILSFLIDQREGQTFTPSRSTWEYNNQTLKLLDEEIK